MLGQRQVGLFGHAQWAHALIASEQGFFEFGIDLIGIGTRPVIDGNGQVVHEIALAGIVKVDETRNIVAVYQYIVFEQVGMNDAVWQIAVVVGIQSGNRVFEQGGVDITHQWQ